MRILRQSTRKDGEPLNLISWSTHERYHGSLGKTKNKFYLIQGQGVKSWNYNYSPIPENHVLLPDLNIPANIDIDIILSQNKAAHYNYAVNIARQTGIPIISLEHCLPPLGIDNVGLSQYRQYRGNIDVFISEYSRNAWGFTPDDSTVIYHGVDTDVFNDRKLERQPYVLSVVNDWQNRDYYCGFNLWRQTTNFPNPNGLPVKVLGDNPGLSEPAKNINDLVLHYNYCGVFLNTSLVSPIPSVLLEAAACGSPIVSTNNCAIPELITHGVNGFLSNNPNELRQYCLQLLKDKELARKMGENARTMVIQKFGMEKFVSSWQNVFRRVLQ